MVPMDGVLVAIGSTFGALGLHLQRVDLPWTWTLTKLEEQGKYGVHISI
jgi:hypothetical protein